jgi:branched-chain amino acid transport system permease protein
MELFPFLVNGLVLGGIYAMVAIGFSIIFTTTRTFHFAHGAIYLWVGYAIYFVTETLRWSLWLALPISAVVALGPRSSSRSTRSTRASAECGRSPG